MPTRQSTGRPTTVQANPTTPRYIAYFRVSTDRQGQSGLGLEAQRQAVTDFLNGNGSEIVQEFTEIESGKRADRPELAKALAACRKHRAILMIAKLDRLARNVAFISSLMDTSAEFVAVDMPSASRLTIHILAAVAEHEREMISRRTREALAAARARGTRLGNPNPKAASAKGGAARKAQADKHAENVEPIIREIKAAGVSTLQGLADSLNARGVASATGGGWHPSTVRRVLQRAE
jgi:DNA invertase Pin-like site-specific DNA recombinase